MPGDINFRIDNRSDNNPGYNDEDFLFVLYQNANPGYYQLRGTRTYHPALGNQRFDDWRVLRYSANPSAFEIFLDDTLVLSVPRDGQSNISVIGTARMIARYARTYEIDWFKLYVENDSLIFHEDFNDVYNLSKPVLGHYCPIEPCEVFFKNFINSRLGKSYSYEQVDSLYQANGLNLTICPGPLTLCGNPEPVFPQVDVNDIDNCSDSSLFIYSAAVEYYKVYKDSIINDFTDRYVEKCLEAYKYESFTVTGPASEYHYTLYYYDQAGNLAKTVPPAGVRLNRNPQWLQEVQEARKTGNYKTPDHELVTNYRYNTLNQVVAQHSPDGGKSSFWYDRLGRLVLSQNASQFAVSSTEEGRLFSYTKYDVLGRITEVGQIKNAQSIVEINQSLTQNQIALQELLANLQAYRGQITRTIYDLPYEPFVLQYSNLLLVQRNLRNRVSYVTYSDTAATSYNTANFYTYDIHGNVDTLLLDYGQSIGAFANIMNKNANRFKKIAYNYDLISGKVNLVAYQHGWADRFYHRYSYDAENRLIKAETSTDSLRWEEDANYQYYLHGPLSRTILGHRQVQGIDYAYTLQGWLKGVNSTAISAEQDMGGDGLSGGLNQYVAKDAYGFNLNYFTGDYSAINENKLPFPGHMAFIAPQEHRQLYNGNISSMTVHNRALDADNLAGGQLLLYNYRYDQLNRITGMDAYNGFDKINNNWQGLTQLNIFKERIAYDANGNILKYLRHGHRSPYVMDSLGYHYYPGTNRLNHVTDQVAAESFGNGQNDVADIDNQNSDNYHYDETGNLVKDLAEGIDKITWTVYGKIASIEKSGGTNIFYTYDPSGNRISKLVQRSTGDKNYTWYVRDAQGNVMATYTAKGNATELSDLELKLNERHLYGSSRLGILTEKIDVDNNNEGPAEIEEEFAVIYARGYRQYELSNHLGNVLATISDKKFGIDSNDDQEIDYFEPEIITASDYYPFGMLMPGRGGSLINGEWQDSGPAVLANLSVDSRTANLPDEYIALESIEFLPGFESDTGDEFVAYITTSSNSGSEGTDGLYRYGFNGKENDSEVKGERNQIDYGLRIYDPRIDRFLSVDPLINSYPWNSPYSYAEGDPINYLDIDGAETGTRTAQATRRPTLPQLSNLSVGRNGRLTNSTQLFSNGSINSGSYSQIRFVTQNELNAMIPPNSGAYINPDGKSMTVHGPNGSWQVSLLRPVEPVKEMTWIDRAILRMHLSKMAAFNPSQWNEGIQTYEIITTDPSTLTDDYLSEVNRRLINGTATTQDRLYANEVSQRKSENKISDPIKITFIQGSGENARKITVDLPIGYKKTNLISHGQAVYTNGKNWITPDQDGHNKGIWKMYSREKDIGKYKSQRLGTYDANLNRIGD